MKVVVYCRVSTTEQATNGLSLDAQEAKALAYADLYELELVGVIRDEGQSAKSLARPGLQEALAMLRRGEADGVLVAKLDRLTRNVGDMSQLISLYFGERARYHATLLSVADQIDTRSASGRLVLNILASIGQWERETTAERTRDALAYKRSQHKRYSRHCPYGWTLAADGETLNPHPGEQELIRLANELKGHGWSLRKIGRELEARGYLQRNGKQFNPNTIRSVLKADAVELAA